MSQIRVDTYYRMSHVTGPGCVLVSLKFGAMPDRGPLVTIRAARNALIEPSMDVDAYVAEVIAGVADANSELGSAVEVDEIEIVPDDFPTLGQVRHCAKTLTLQHKKSTEQAVAPNRSLAPTLNSTSSVRGSED